MKTQTYLSSLYQALVDEQFFPEILIFDWNLIKNLEMASNWILSGGLSPENIGDAIKITGANFVDVSSGVENNVGIKDNDLITKFIYNARNYMEKN